MRQLLLKIFLFPFAVSLYFIFLSGCEKKYDTVIDSSESAPVLASATWTLSKVYSDTMYNTQGTKQPLDILAIRGLLSLKVFHLEGNNEIASVKFVLTDNQTFATLVEGNIYDNGIAPDLIAQDSIFTCFVDYQFERVFVGKLSLSISSVNRFGDISNTAILPLEIIRRDNQKPLLSNLQMDTIVVIGGTQDTLQLRITAYDPDGQSDILRVSFNSFRPPNGTPATGNPFFLYDDGSPIHRDAIAGDGVYSQAVILPTNTPLGTYRFEFQAVDRSLDSSKVIIQSIVITH